MEARRSEQLNELFSALSKAQSEMPAAGLNQSNPFYKSRYANLADIVRVSRPYLTKNGLSVEHDLTYDKDGNEYCRATLGHASGQWKESIMKINPAKNDIQSRSSYITYAMRITYKGLVGVICTDEEDDDGEAAVAPTRNETRVEQKNDKISRDQFEVISRKLMGYEQTKNTILKRFNISKLDDLPKSEIFKILEWVDSQINLLKTVS